MLFRSPTSSALTHSALGVLPKRALPADIVLYLDAIKAQLDVDGDGQTNAASDGVLLLRYLSGMRGNALTAGLTGLGPRSVQQIEAAIAALMP